MSTEQLIGVLDQLGDLGCEKSLEAVDTLGFLTGGRELVCHLVEARCQLLQFVAARDRDAIVELSGADPPGSILQLPDWTRHSIRQPICEQKSDKRADPNESKRPPQGSANGRESLCSRL